MVKRVVDTSVAVKWFFQEEGTDRAETLLEELEQKAGQAIVPLSMFYEFSNVLWVKRRKGLTEEKAATIWAELLQLPLEVIDGIDYIPQALSFSFRHEVSPYDAVFLVLAQNLACDFITADETLWRKVHESCPWVIQL
jgi:predicted nucleic acid-binding protein